MNGWMPSPRPRKLLSNLGIPDAMHQVPMKQLEASEKVRVPAAQALFGNPVSCSLTNRRTIWTSRPACGLRISFMNSRTQPSSCRMTPFPRPGRTHIADIDYGKIQLFTGNFSFWSNPASSRSAEERGEQGYRSRRKELSFYRAVQRERVQSRQLRRAKSFWKN